MKLAKVQKYFVLFTIAALYKFVATSDNTVKKHHQNNTIPCAKIL